MLLTKDLQFKCHTQYKYTEYLFHAVSIVIISSSFRSTSFAELNKCISYNVFFTEAPALAYASLILCSRVGDSLFDYLVIGLFFLLSHSTHLVTRTSPKIGKLAMKR